MNKIFKVKNEHLLLLKHLQFKENGSVPEINKRCPFGSTFIDHSICDAIGWTPSDSELGLFSDKQYNQGLELSKELVIVLQILCQNFMIEEGEYEFFNNNWIKCKK